MIKLKHSKLLHKSYVEYEYNLKKNKQKQEMRKQGAVTDLLLQKAKSKPSITLPTKQPHPMMNRCSYGRDPTAFMVLTVLLPQLLRHSSDHG